MNRLSMESISIVIPYDEADTKTAVWSEEEKKIDFRNDVEKAARCTMSFAAVELKKFLSKTLFAADISFTSCIPGECIPGGNFFITLKIIDKSSKDDGFSIEPCRGGVGITGRGRTGLLYGAYEFLRMQGWRWYAPGKEGEIAPEPKNELDIPVEIIEYAASMNLGRGFYFEGISRESSELWLWMARNRLNLTTYRPATGPLGNKLGMTFRVGGHIFESILNPDRIISSGRTLWEEHENWYGLPVNGARKKEKALLTQFCVTQPDLIEFLGEELLLCLTGEWKEAEQIDIWGFDTWGNNCTCKYCKNLGNGTDQMLFFLSSLRKFINHACDDGRLDHKVKLVICGYEGTSTISGPMNPFPWNLVDADDYVTFFPIKRCYAHNFKDSCCATNKPYSDVFESWFKHKPHLPVMLGEYYNVSKYEDLPILFTGSMQKDFLDYYSYGVRGITYMHLPMVNWGMRTLTQILYAQLAWDINTDTKVFLNDYFRDWYGPYAEEMCKVYELLENAWLFCADWRNWGQKSVLTELQAWNGSIPREPLLLDNHFQTPLRAVDSGRKSVVYMQEAKRILTEVRDKDKQTAAVKSGIKGKIAINSLEPSKIEKLEGEDTYEMRLGEDYRLLIYGLDTMNIMTELTAYHDALYRNEPDAAETSWRRIEETEERLNSYYIPISYESPGAGLISKDALTRTQVRDLLRRIRKYRLGNS